MRSSSGRLPPPRRAGHSSDVMVDAPLSDSARPAPTGTRAPRPAPEGPVSVSVDQLRAVAGRHPTAEKVLLTPVGDERWQPPQTAVTLLDRLSRAGIPWVGFRDASVGGLARRAAEASMAASGLRPVSRIGQLFLVRRLCDELIFGRDGYFAGLTPGRATYEAFRRALGDLRLAGLGPEDLRAGDFVDPRKGRELARLMAAYEERLAERGRLDAAGLLRLALEAARAGEVAEREVLLVPRELTLAPLEAELLEVLPARHRYLLGWSGDRGLEPGPDRAARRLGERWTPAPTGEDGALPHRAGLLFRARDLPAGAGGELELELALGAENEVRALLRRVLEESAPLDRVEVAYPPGGYRSLLLSEAERFGFGVTFAEGVPVELTGPGRALDLLYEWILEDYDDRILRRMLRSGLLDLRGLGLELLPAQAAELLRTARVGRGRDRYGTGLRRLSGRLEARIGRRRTEGRPTAALQRRLELAGELERLVDPSEGLLWSFVPPDGEVEVAEVAERSLAFLERAVATGPGDGSGPDPLEPAAAESLAGRLRDLVRDVDGRMPSLRAVRFLRDEIEGHPVSRSGPRPGRLHAAPLAAAGYSGRPHLFVVGLDEASFPGEGLEDPVLLDRERRALPAELTPRRRAPADRLHDLARALGDAGGRVTVSASVRDVADDRELYPSSAFLQAWRVRVGDPDAGFEACLDALSPPRSFVPDGEAPACVSEAWLARPDRGGEGYLRRVHQRHPGLAAGREAERRRAGPDFTAWDGRVEAPPERLDPRRTGEVVSPSRLETLLESPYRYFLRYVLGLEPVEELDYEPGSWLSPLDRGALLHRLFHEVMAELRDRDEPADAERHRGLVESATDRLLERWRDRIPPPTEGAFRREAREIRRTAESFLRDEADRAAEARPLAFEVRFGRTVAPDASPLASREPVELELGEAGRLAFRGAIDRVDRVEEGAYRVWDYKTGSTSRYDRSDPFEGGHLQWLLYALALERLLEREGRGGRVLRSGYLFPGTRGHGDRMAFPVDEGQVDRMGRLLSERLDLVAAGLFPHATDARDCAWCDYRGVCGDPGLRADQAARKLEALREAGGPDSPDGDDG